MGRHPMRNLMALIALALVAGAGPARAGDLRPELAALAKDLAKFLEGRGESAIGVGVFSGPPSTSAGPGVAQVLGEELKKINVQVRPGAKLGVKGEYLFAEQLDDQVKKKLLVVKIKATIVDKLGTTLLDLPLERVVSAEADIAQLAGVPLAMPAEGRVKERDQKLRESIADPKTEVAGTRVAAGPHYAIEILVDGHACAPRVEDGLAFVPIARNNTYAVRLINDSDLDAAVRLTIDGLSTFAFSEVRATSGPHKGEPLYNVWLVPPHKTLLVPGWHVTNERADQFVVTEFAKSAAAELKSEGGVGTITATFSAAWSGDTPPADEPPQKRAGGGDATGRGKPLENRLTEEVRTVGAVRASTSVRYTK